MLGNKATILLVATIFLMVTIYGTASARELTVINNSDTNLRQNQSVNGQLNATETLTTDTINNSNKNPAIYGDNVVWQNFRSEGWMRDIYLYNFNTSTGYRITASGSAENPKIYGDRIVWKDNRSGDDNIYMYNISTRKEVPITSNMSDQKSPVIYGNRIVWMDNRNGNWSNENWSKINSDIYMYNLSTNNETRITTSLSAYGPAIYGDRIVYSDNRKGNWSNISSNLYMYDISTSNETQITDSGRAYSAAVYRDRIVWMDERHGNKDIYMYDVPTSREYQITTNLSTQRYPAMYGDRIVWLDDRNGNGTNAKSDIYMYNLSTLEETQITNSGSATRPAFYGDRIVWADSLNVSFIHMYNISTSEEIQINTSELSPAIPGENGTGRIYVYASLPWNPDLTVDLGNPGYTISGPGVEYVGTGYWAKTDAPVGTYAISYELVNGYVTPISETKNLKEGNSIKFSGNYLLKKRAGESLDMGDDYVLLIKQINPEIKEVILELYLDGSRVDEVRVGEHQTVDFNKRSFSVNKSGERNPSKIIIGNMSQDTEGNYVGLSFEFPKPLDVGYIDQIKPRKKLSIDSNPRGAKIFLDGDYMENTQREMIIPIDDKVHSIDVELEGYERWNTQYKFDTNEIVANLTKTRLLDIISFRKV